MRAPLFGCILLSFALPAYGAPGSAEFVEDFEGSEGARGWSFSNGSEFPGASGSFRLAAEGAHTGKAGGVLRFDFKRGGRYVAAILQVPETKEATALRFWLLRPEGHDVQLRYTDSTGQTFQKPVESEAGKWGQAAVSFESWSTHWGGANDGKVHGRPRQLAIVIGQGERTEGELLFDDLQWADASELTVRVSYTPYVFSAEEGWQMRSDGNRGSSTLGNGSCVLDYSKGATQIILSVPDRVLLGDVKRIRLHATGRAAGHPVRLSLRTHFMTFYKDLGEFSGDGEQVLETEGPPGEGWKWQGGENDGKIHGPLRVGELRFSAGDQRGISTLKNMRLEVESVCPTDRQCMVTAETQVAEENPSFVASIRALARKELKGRLVYVVRDWERNEVARETKAISIPTGGRAVRVVVPVRRGWTQQRRFLEAEFTLEVPGQRTPACQASWIGKLAASGDGTLEPESPFGMGVYLNRYGGDERGLALMERAARMARDAGVKWSREDFSWGRIEPRRGEYDWKFYDNLVACARRNGITVYGIVGYWTGWTKPYTEEGIEDYVRFVEALVGRYQNEIKHWEIWNEPNIFFWQGPKDMYAQLLSRSYAAVKALDPEAQVLGLSTAGIDNKYIDRMLELGAPFDILTIHPYRKHLNDLEFIRDLKSVADQVRLPDGRMRPVWLTEMGWATHTPHHVIGQDFAANSQRTQAELIVRSYLCAIVSGVEPRTFWYNFRNDGDDPVYFEHQMGIVYQDFRPKPAYLAYTTLTSQLSGKRFENEIATPEGVLGYRFARRDGQKTLVLWSPGRDVTAEIPVNSRSYTRINAVGETQPTQVRAGKAKVDLKKGAVVYLVPAG